MTLKWSNPERRTLSLEQSRSGSFDDALVRYEGTDVSSVIAGLEEGTHHFRLRPGGLEGASDPVAVEVKFFPREKLLLLLGLGAFVVAATIGTIVGGGIRTRREGAEP